MPPVFDRECREASGKGTSKKDGKVVWTKPIVLCCCPLLQVNCFIVRKGAPGFKATKIENKIALRCVQNADMLFEDCFVPDSAKLPGVDSFKDTNKVGYKPCIT